jgi:hypothetical protein
MNIFTTDAPRSRCDSGCVSTTSGLALCHARKPARAAPRRAPPSAVRPRIGIHCQLPGHQIWPGLDCIYRRRLRHSRSNTEELVVRSSLVFTALLGRMAFSRLRRVAATLDHSTERDMMEGRRREWSERDHQTELSEEGTTRLAPQTPPLRGIGFGRTSGQTHERRCLS